MKSVTIGVFTLFSVLVFSFTLAFIWNSSAGVQYKRVAMAGDRPLEEIFPEPESRSQSEPLPLPTDEGPGDQQARENSGDDKNTVVWISIPGFRGDYLEKAEPKLLQKMADEGASTNTLRPNFPSLTYPGHITLATGATPDIHGIPSDRFKVGNSILKNPVDPSLLLAEPIWNTATRQGIVSLVHDWPLSQNQTGSGAAAYFLSEFDPKLDDQQRLDRLWDLWAGHRGDTKIRLLMTRLDDVLKAGLVNGPRADETYEAIRETDRILASFLEKTKAALPNLHESRDGNLIFVITTDHGLAEINKNINLVRQLGSELMKHLEVAAHDAVAHLYFKNLPTSEAEANLVISEIDQELRRQTYFRTYKPGDLPSDWKYRSNDGRIGDRVLVLRSNFAFSDFQADEAIFDPSDGPGFYGGFGYPVSNSIQMSGQAIIWSHPSQIVYGDLGEIDQTIFSLNGLRFPRNQARRIGKQRESGVSVINFSKGCAIRKTQTHQGARQTTPKNFSD